MFAILNRLRGTFGFFSFINGFILYSLTYGLTLNLYLSMSIYIGYVLGESMGWGKWIGGIINGNEKATIDNINENEGVYNGIHFIANWIEPEKEYYQHYCNVALSIRGFYWAFLSMLPLLVFGYIGYLTLIAFSILIGIGFPISVIIGKYTSSKFTYEYGYLSMNGAWEHAEVWYGLIQDISIILLIILIYKNIQI